MGEHSVAHLFEVGVGKVIVQLEISRRGETCFSEGLELDNSLSS